MAAENAAPAESHSAEPESSESRPSSERGFWGLVAKATALVVLISAVVALVVQFWPEPEPVQTAEIPKVRVESGLTFRQYLEDVGQDPGNLSDDVLRQKGALIQFTVEATGYKGEHLRLKWQVVDLGTHDRPLKNDAITVTPGAVTDRLNTNPVFAASPKQGGPFNVHGELFAPDGVSIADADEDFER
jgi:hypothetical protein